MNNFIDLKLSQVIRFVMPSIAFCIAALLFYKNGWSPADWKSLAAIIFSQTIVPVSQAMLGNK